MQALKMIPLVHHAMAYTKQAPLEHPHASLSPYSTP